MARHRFQHQSITWRRPHAWLLALCLTLMASAALVFVPNILADAPARPAASQVQWDDQLAQSQILNGDLTVEPGEVIESDVVVYSGDAEVKDGGRITGNLVVYSGDIDIDQGGTVDGDVTAFSGNVEIGGTVHGDVASWSGDVELKETASVDGDLSVVSGDIVRAAAAAVGGNVVQGPNLKLGLPNLGFGLNPPDSPAGPSVTVQRSQPSFGERLANLFLRLLAGVGVALVFLPLAALITYSRPDYITRIATTMREQTPLSFVVGLFTNLILIVLSVLLIVTICGIILAPLPLFLLLALNLVGWTAVASTVGRWLSTRLGTTWSPAVTVAVGVIGLGVVLIPLVTLGGCFRFFASAFMLIVGSFGLGAVVLPWLNKARGADVPDLPAVSHGPLVDAQAMTSVAGASVDAAMDAAVDAAVHREPVAPVGEDDFTRINGVGQVFDARLKVAGVRTFAQLAALTPEAIADIIGWPVERVLRTELIEQAAVLAEEQ